MAWCFVCQVEQEKERIRKEEEEKWERIIEQEKEEGEQRIREEEQRIEAKIQEVKDALAQKYEEGFRPLIEVSTTALLKTSGLFTMRFL